MADQSPILGPDAAFSARTSGPSVSGKFRPISAYDERQLSGDSIKRLTRGLLVIVFADGGFARKSVRYVAVASSTVEFR